MTYNLKTTITTIVAILLAAYALCQQKENSSYTVSITDTLSKRYAGVLIAATDTGISYLGKGKINAIRYPAISKIEVNKNNGTFSTVLGLAVMANAAYALTETDNVQQGALVLAGGTAALGLVGYLTNRYILGSHHLKLNLRKKPISIQKIKSALATYEFKGELVIIKR